MKHAPPILALLIGIVPAFAQTSDTTAPVLTSFFFSPTSVDVSSAQQTVTVNATISDDLAGFGSGAVSFRSPNGQLFSGGFSRTAGTALAGAYQAVVTIPRFAQGGTWKAQAFLSDNAGNSRNVAASELQSHSFPTDLTVIDSNADTAPPTVTGASFSPSIIDVSSGPVNVTVSLQVTDNLSGACFTFNCGLVAFAVILSPPFSTLPTARKYISAEDFHLVSGTPLNGLWQAVATIPRYSPTGNWQIQSVALQDIARNGVSLGTGQLQAAGINPTLSVSSSPSDTTPPVLTSLTLSPTVLNTSTGPQAVTMTLHATDNLSGVDFSPTTPSLAFIQFGFTSPSGGQTAFISPFNVPAVGGTPLSGTWQLSTTLPRFSEEGTWKVSFFTLKDTATNQTSYTSAMLEAMGFPDTFVVTKPSLNVDGTVGSAGGMVTDDSFGSRASVTFPPNLAPPNTNVSIDVFPNPLPVPTPGGFTVPGTYFVNVAFSPALSSPLPSPGITVVLPLLTPMTPGAHLSLYHIDPVTGTLQPTSDAFHNSPVQGTVNSGGVSATFLNVVTLSTVVAYLPNGSVLGDVNNDGLVDCTDVSLLKASFGKRTGQAGFNSNADLNNDGVVDIRDLLVVTRQLPAGTTCP